MRGRDYAAMTDPARNPHFSRRWGEPTHIHKIAKVVVDRVARQAIRHWLHQAESLDGANRVQAFNTADDIRRGSGLTWDDILDVQRVA